MHVKILLEPNAWLCLKSELSMKTHQHKPISIKVFWLLLNNLFVIMYRVTKMQRSGTKLGTYAMFKSKKIPVTYYIFVNVILLSCVWSVHSKHNKIMTYYRRHQWSTWIWIFFFYTEYLQHNKTRLINQSIIQFNNYILQQSNAYNIRA